ncbi:MAG: DNA repair protein RadA [bacterium]|nr:DNA repair protein RadA [bacterium]
MTSKSRRRQAAQTTYRCGQCGFTTGKWMGFCPQCRSEGSLEESVVAAGPSLQTQVLSEVSVSGKPRTPTGIGEVDRVLGGGFVGGSVVLVGGEPGVGKSTLLLQLAAQVADQGSVLLASAEESASQVALRATRLGLNAPGLRVVADGRVEAVLSACVENMPDLLIIDSIQTVTTADAEGSAGGVVQVRESAGRFIEFAKRTGTVVALVGHVTKEGSIAGPKTLEHMVDVVMYLEGEGDGGLRLLRSLKNRYGSVNQVGVFTMGDVGLDEVPDPSGVLVEAHRAGASGTVLFPMVEGRRSMLCEVQALVVQTVLPQPRRSVKGLDGARVHQLLAVLERHAGVQLVKADVHVNVVGGVRLKDPAVDLAVALAIVSSVQDRPLPLTAAWGEVGLTGEIRTATHGERRQEEASRFDPELVVRPGKGGIRTLHEALLEAGLTPGRR